MTEPLTILLVERNAFLSRVLTRFLHHNMDVTVNAIAEEDANAQVQTLRPDVVLIDPRQLDTITRLRALRPDVGIIGMSFIDADVVRAAHLRAGVDAFVGKPDLTTDLLPALRQVTSSRGARPDLWKSAVHSGTRYSNEALT